MDEINLNLRDVVNVCSLQVLTGEDLLDRKLSFVLASDLMSDVLAFSRPKFLLVTGLCNPQSVITANIAGALAVLYSRGKSPSPGTVKMAGEFGIPLLTSKEDTFTVCGRLFQVGCTDGLRRARKDRR